MESKYYTPEIEEFHVGFEYEVMYFQKQLSEIYDINHLIEGDDFIWITRKWKELDEFKNSFSISEINGERKISVPDSIRVKHLDREDIISLGWKKNKNIFRPFVISTTKGNFILNNGKTLEIREYIFMGLENVLFKGTIKNKNELKWLMKRLQILD